MISIATEHLLDMNSQVPTEQAIDIGSTPQGTRRKVKLVGGEFDGAKLKGSVVEGNDSKVDVGPGVLYRFARAVAGTAELGTNGGMA